MLNEHYEGDGAIVFRHACKLGCEGIVSKRLGSQYRSGRTKHWLKVKNPEAPAVAREAEKRRWIGMVQSRRRPRLIPVRWGASAARRRWTPRRNIPMICLSVKRLGFTGDGLYLFLEKVAKLRLIDHVSNDRLPQDTATENVQTILLRTTMLWREAQ